MAMTINNAHQWALASSQVIPLAELVNGASVPVCELPGDAVIVGVSVNVDEALAGGTVTAGTATLQFAAAGGDVALSTAIDITAAGSTFEAPASGAITGEVANVEADISVTGSGATAGSVIVTVLYTRRDRANEIR